MLAPVTRVFILLLLSLCGGLGVLFWRRQNVHAAKGGRISPPKMAWLLYAIFLWFFLCPLVALDPGVSPRLRLVLGGFGAFMWLRGLAELYMLYVSHNWRPPYGIAHDVLSLVLVLGGLGAHLLSPPGTPSPLDTWAVCLVALVVVSLVIEVLYAALFFHAVEGRTMGEEGIWFADEEQVRFRRINRITLACNIPLYLLLGGLLAVALGFGL
ncbi:hypothetical protein [Cystobacter fuscus]|uniref:hypothetical protein n=1 Tax=Cystobacter fuscus TaxID=43 RepID=UPI002B32218D|nr:hypothetical protein F0U63_02380 [Cystobacter fuscus]